MLSREQHLELPGRDPLPRSGYLGGGALYPVSPAGIFAHCPGLRVVLPSCASDAAGSCAAMQWTIRAVPRYKHLYRQPYARAVRGEHGAVRPCARCVPAST
jgi:hypothetical protein